ncbi:hypothetical protein V2G26_005019 [Clonostachys chloroleuca]
MATITQTVSSPAPTLSTTADHDRLVVNGMAKDSNPPQLQIQAKTKDGRLLKMRTQPKFDNPEDERMYRKQHLAAACRVFASRGFDEGVAGHFSVRDPILTDHFWLNPLCRHFSLMKASDLILVDEEGNVVEGDEPINLTAFTIHAAIHKARPDVNAACHAHSVAGKAFSAFARDLEPITQDALRFYKDLAIYKQFKGAVVDDEEGERIAEALGDCKAAILMNHGLLTVGGTVDEAAFWFLSLDKSCQAQLMADAAAAAGYKKIYIDEQEAEYTAKQVGGPEKGWLAFQPYFDEQVAKSNGELLK